MKTETLKKLNIAAGISAALCVLFIIAAATVGFRAPQPQNQNTDDGIKFAVFLVFFFIPTTVGAGIFGTVVSALGITVLAKSRKNLAPKGVYISAAVFEILTAILLAVGSAPLAAIIPVYAVNCVSAVILLAAAVLSCIVAAKRNTALPAADAGIG